MIVYILHSIVHDFNILSRNPKRPNYGRVLNFRLTKAPLYLPWTRHSNNLEYKDKLTMGNHLLVTMCTSVVRWYNILVCLIWYFHLTLKLHYNIKMFYFLLIYRQKTFKNLPMPSYKQQRQLCPMSPARQREAQLLATKYRTLFSLFACCHNIYNVAKPLDGADIDLLGISWKIKREEQRKFLKQFITIHNHTPRAYCLFR